METANYQILKNTTKTVKPVLSQMTKANQK